MCMSAHVSTNVSTHVSIHVHVRARTRACVSVRQALSSNFLWHNPHSALLSKADKEKSEILDDGLML